MIDKRLRQNAYSRKSYLKNKAVRLIRTKQYQKELKLRTISYYGGDCQCCGEKEIKFLGIDHLNGGGSKHRKELGITAGIRFYFWLQKNKFPEGFQVLCHNCNQAKGSYGVCPHQELLSQTKGGGR